MIIAKPSQDAIWAATLSMTNESADPDYAVENAQDSDPANTARATGTSTAVTANTGSKTVVGAAVMNTNATTITITNGAGLNQPIVVPGRTADGKQRNGWVDLRGVANTTATSFIFNLSKAGSVPLEFGRLVLLVALTDLAVVWEGAGQVEFGERRPGEYENVTRLGTKIRRPSPVAAPRTLRGESVLESQMAFLRALQAENRGLNRGFFVVPYDDQNDAWFADLVMEDESTWRSISRAVTRLSLNIEEKAMGLPPDLS